MKIKVIPTDSELPVFEAEVIREYSRNSICHYGIKHKDYKGFQFDDYSRPNNYSRQYAQERAYRGYMIGKKNKQTIECNVKVIYSDDERKS